MANYTGTPLKRFEDGPLLRGQGSYVDDIQLPNMLYASVVRSIHAHARILSIDASAARSMPGVVDVLTARDLEGKARDIPVDVREDVEYLTIPEHPVLAGEKVCYVGQLVAVVVAQDRYTARDALDLVQVEYEPLPPVLNPLEATQGKPRLIHEGLSTNIAMRIREKGGDVEAAFSRADHIVRERYESPRLSAAPMEARGVVASYQPQEEMLTIWTSTQVPHRIKTCLPMVLTAPPKNIRVVAPDVGGGFGQKVEIWPEEIAISYLSTKLERPIKWIEDRMENLLCYQGRGYTGDVEAAVNKDGSILAMRYRIVADVGAYFMARSASPLINAAHRVAGPYDIPNMEVECLGVLTNKPPTGPYRGAGGPESSLLLERIVNRIARELGLDPVEVRRRNFLSKEAFPHTTATGLTYDSGDYAPALDRALELGQYHHWRQVQRETGPDEPLIGVGVATVVKSSGGRGETRISNALVRVEPTGQVKVYTELSPHGQGTETSFAQIAADQLGVRPEDVQVLHGDSEMLPSGQGTYASRGLTVGGSAVFLGLQEARNKISLIASRLLGCSPEDIVLQEGKVFNRRDPEQAMAFSQVASAAQRQDLLPPGLESGLDFPVDYTLPATPFSFAAHVVVVQVDQHTGEVKFLRYAAVHDCGPTINPMIVDGQLHGGIAQGIGQALSEGMLYSPEGQPLTSSFMDYVMPMAENMPILLLDRQETPSPTNPMGIKGAGELPTVASPVAVANAIVDALSAVNPHIDIPLTSEKVWRALHKKG